MIRQKLKINNPDQAEDEWEADIVVDDTKCPQLTWEMREGYRWPQHKSDVKNDSEIPQDKDNHGPEALGRFIHGYFTVTGNERSTRSSRARTGYGSRKRTRAVRR